MLIHTNIIQATVDMSIFSYLVAVVRNLFFSFAACVFQTQVVARNKTL